MSYDTSESAAYAVLFTVLAIFTLLAIASADYFKTCLPSSVRSLIVLKTTPDDDVGEGENANRTPDFFLSARNSASGTAIALSYFASGMGAWVVYGTTEMGANPQLSWLGVLGYSGASAFPAIIICMIGPKVKRMTETGGAFCTTDFCLLRYGRVMQLVCAVVSIFYMFIFIVAELTSISNIYGLIVGTDTFSSDTLGYTTGIAVIIGVFTIFYTSMAGLPASIVTDKFQGFIMGFLVLLLTIAVCSVSENQVTREEFSKASNWTGDGFMAAVTLFLAIASAEMFNQGTWQRVWAAKSVPDMRRGFLLGSVLVFFLMMFFGIMGMIAYAKDPTAYDNFEKYAYLAFFDLLAPLSNAWHVIVLILVTALAASSVDSLQNALTCIFSRDLMQYGWNPKWVSRVLLVAVNIPAIWLSAKRYDVIGLFLVADLVCATSVLPVFLGLMEKDWGIITAPTELGALLGCISGIVTVIVNGYISGGEGWVGANGGLFYYFFLQNGDICALCGSKTMVTFIVTPLFSGILTLVFSRFDVMLRGEQRARMSLLHNIYGTHNDDIEPVKGDEKDVHDSVTKEEPLKDDVAA